nr:hypothetical protein [Lachnospiraceae bacterium]
MSRKKISKRILTAFLAVVTAVTMLVPYEYYYGALRVYADTTYDISDATVSITSATEVTYTGAQQTASVSVTYSTDSGDTAIPSENYTIYYLMDGEDTAYTYALDAGTYYVYAVGTGNGSGTSEYCDDTFVIDPKSLSSDTISVVYDSLSFDYGDTDTVPEFTITDTGITGNYTLEEGTDYEVAYTNSSGTTVSASSISAVGTYYVTITGEGNYTGTLTYSFTISKASLSNFTVAAENAPYIYTGSAITPTLSFTKNSSQYQLAQDTDYTVQYYYGSYEEQDNGTYKLTWTATDTVKEIGPYYAIVTGKGNYSGTSQTETFYVAYDLTECTLTYTAETFTYNGAAQTLSNVVVTANIDGTATVVPETENGVANYTITYSNNVNAGTATMTITGHNQYSGTISASYQIQAIDLLDVSGLTITLGSADVSTDDDDAYTTEYDSNAKKPAVTLTVPASYYSSSSSDKSLTLSSDYTVSYVDNTDAGVADVYIKGTGNYKGTIIRHFTIEPYDISTSGSGVNASIDDQAYTGYVITPEDYDMFTIVDNTSNSNTLVGGTDYVISGYPYNTDGTTPDNLTAGTDTGVVQISGTGNYEGDLSVNFDICNSIKTATITLDSDYDLTYTSGSIEPPVDSVTLNGATLTEGTDYTVSYSNNVDVGTATVTVSGTGAFTGKATTTFEITQRSIDTSASTTSGSFVVDSVSGLVAYGEEYSVTTPYYYNSG